jgi:hypothetical protein
VFRGKTPTRGQQVFARVNADYKPLLHIELQVEIKGDKELYCEFSMYFYAQRQICVPGDSCASKKTKNLYTYIAHRK